MADIHPLFDPEAAPQAGPAEVAAKLRRIAAEVESGEQALPRCGVLVLVDHHGAVSVFGMGQDGGDMLACAGALAWGRHWFARAALDAAEEAP